MHIAESNHRKRFHWQEGSGRNNQAADPRVRVVLFVECPLRATTAPEEVTYK